jgi:hypothetical protein
MTVSEATQSNRHVANALAPDSHAGMHTVLADDSAPPTGRSKPYLDVLRQLVGGQTEGEPQAGLLHRRRPWSRANTSISNTWQILAGALLIPLGIMFLLLGWYGAAHARYVQQQIPYVASGTGIGLACLVLGGALYWAHWLYRIYDQSDLHHREEMEQSERHHQEQLRALELAWGTTEDREDTTARAATGSRRRKASAVESDAASGYLGTANGTAYHDPACPILAHHAQGALPLTSAATATMKPCRICITGGQPGGGNRGRRARGGP